jgi:ABC-2 type transport system permease protein
MPVIYGYLVPVIFLIGFAAVFRGSVPPLLRQLGQLLTISVLGGACFGMPTAMVAERERGIWRRYRLLPLATGALVCSTMIARLVLVATSGLLQFALAMWLYAMPLPAHPLQLIAAFLFVSWAFLGLGLVIAMLAENVPAVQALGQAIFLPMILIGGVGVPLRALPDWAQRVADFFPGRYAVEALDATITGPGLSHVIYSLIALAVIGAAACFAGVNMFRWDAGERLPPNRKGWTLLALAAWAAVGIAAQLSGHSAAILDAPSAYEAVTDAQINSITYEDLQDDGGLVTPLVDSLDDISPAARQWIADFRPRLSAWPPGQEADPVQRVRNILSLCAVADIAEYQYEGEVPFVAFAQIQGSIPKPDLEKILAYIILRPGEGRVLTFADELGIHDAVDEAEARSRTAQYAKKLLGRILGKIS